MLPVEVHLKLVTLSGDTRQKTHKQPREGENRGACAQTAGLSSSLVAATPGRVNRVKSPSWGPLSLVGCWHWEQHGRTGQCLPCQCSHCRDQPINIVNRPFYFPVINFLKINKFLVLAFLLSVCNEETVLNTV